MLLLIALFSYLIGSLSFAVILSHWAGLPDPRNHGSRNPGASNMLRLGHQWLAGLVLIGDSLKAVIPLAFAKTQGFSDTQLAWLMVAACLGHMFPVFFNLRGGKGIATALGGLMMVSWPAAVIALGIWIGVFMLCRYASIASLVAIGSTLISAAWLSPPSAHIPLALIAGLLTARHSSNWARLREGTELKVKLHDYF